MPPKAKPDTDKTDKIECKCGTCVKPVADQDNGVLCEICDNWYHSRCQGITESMYKALSQFSADLHWFCKNCRTGAEKLLASMAKMQSKVDKLEDEMVRIKTDCDKSILQAVGDIKKELTQLNDRMGRYETAIQTHTQEIQSKVGVTLSDFENKLRTTEEPSWTDIVKKQVETKLSAVTADMQTVHNVLEQQAKAIQEDKEELAEMGRRRTSIIVHGLLESGAAEDEAREKEDEDRLVNLLHALDSDRTSVNAFIRLGRKSEDSSVTPRPVKMILTSEEQKDKLLRKSKNLRGRTDELGKVFIHQDLTPKQRDARHQLVEEMKRRRDLGEPNLIIVNGKIVTRKLRNQ